MNLPQFTRFYLGERMEQSLRVLKARTGLSANLLCRIGFCLSLSDLGVPDPALYLDMSVKEINRATLTGQCDSLFFALLRERMVEDGLDGDEALTLEAQFKAHMNRGVGLLAVRVKSLLDLAALASALKNPVDDSETGSESAVADLFDGEEGD